MDLPNSGSLLKRPAVAAALVAARSVINVNLRYRNSYANILRYSNAKKLR